MIIKIAVEIVLDIGDRDPEEVCTLLNLGLIPAVESFPEGDVIQANVDSFEKMSAEEIKERGFEE